MSDPTHEPWQAAIREQRFADVERLVKQTPSLVREPIVFTRGDGSTYRRMPLCVSNKSLDIVRLLVKAGANVNAADPDGGARPLSGPTAEVGEFLVARGADINAFGYENLTPLAYAAYDRNLALIVHLVSHGASVHRAHPANGITPLHYAASKCSATILGVLLGAGADPNQPDAKGRTPLDWAESEGRTEEILGRLKGAHHPLQ